MEETRLASVPLFAGLNKKELRALASRTDSIDVAEGKQLAREGISHTSSSSSRKARPR